MGVEVGTGSRTPSLSLANSSLFLVDTRRSVPDFIPLKTVSLPSEKHLWASLILRCHILV
jgi:hypothetical protein